MSEIKQTPKPDYINLLNSQTLHNSTTASMIVLYVQEHLRAGTNKPNVVFPESLAYLHVGACNMLNAIREINSETIHQQSGPKAEMISKNIHEELYYYDGQITKLIFDFIDTQDNYFKTEYMKTIDRIQNSKKLI